jgi:phosphoribosylanthranilate isomerase
MTRVKICGITRWEDARLAVELGASALGFNFFPPSPRYIAPAEARKIVEQLPPFVVAVGIFANETDGKRVAAVAREAGMAAVQLHGPRFPKVNGALGRYPLIRAVAVRDGSSLERLRDWKASAYLLDAYHPKLLGGTGKKFDWKIANEAKKYGPIILAGGLTPRNVGKAIRVVRPFAVDVASGVESAPGIKDPAKLRAFFAAVAKADKTL